MTYNTCENKYYLDPFFDAFFGKANQNIGYLPLKTDVYESEKAYRLDMELPGFHKEDILRGCAANVSPAKPPGSSIWVSWTKRESPLPMSTVSSPSFFRSSFPWSKSLTRSRSSNPHIILPLSDKRRHPRRLFAYMLILRTAFLKYRYPLGVSYEEKI